MIMKLAYEATEWELDAELNRGGDWKETVAAWWKSSGSYVSIFVNICMYPSSFAFSTIGAHCVCCDCGIMVLNKSYIIIYLFLLVLTKSDIIWNGSIFDFSSYPPSGFSLAPSYS